MDFVVVGAGAIGGTVGAHLSRAGHDVLFVDAARDHVAAMRRDGLRITGQVAWAVPVPATTPDCLAAALEGRQLRHVILAVKAMHTRDAMRAVAPLLAPDGWVASFQNGLLEPIIAEFVGPERVIGAFINFGADYHEPGVVRYGGGGAAYLGELDGRTTPRLEGLAAAVRDAFLPNTTVTSNIWGYLWGKMGYGAMLFTTALTDETIADVLAAERYRAALANVAAEAIRAAASQGIQCEGFDGYDPAAVRFSHPRDWPGIRRSLDALTAFNRRSLKQYSGVWRDLAVRKRKTEVDFQVGAVVEESARLGLDAPLCALVRERIHAIEDGRASMSREHLDDLRNLSAETYPDKRCPFP
ncbi:MAG: 2-dehydropantoate 2-reductase [Armatimonadetes bacterium]|nr:2-dehydropantoate 2-reductase [Armatimonadota bacterium]